MMITGSELIQIGSNKRGTWCKSKGLSVNSEEIEVVLFTRKWKTNKFVRFEYQGAQTGRSSRNFPDERSSS